MQKVCEIISIICISGYVRKIITINFFSLFTCRQLIFLEAELSEKGDFEY